jgi:hypothetical protein
VPNVKCGARFEPIPASGVFAIGEMLSEVVVVYTFHLAPQQKYSMRYKQRENLFNVFVSTEK